MAQTLDGLLDRWLGAGLIDSETAARIRAYEAEQPGGGLRWPVLLAVACGGLLSGAGVLLFVAAHWDELSPTARMPLVLLLVAVFHVAGTLIRDRFPSMTVTLHALGTLALGAGVYLAGQIFHLERDWSVGALLWAAGAAIGWLLLRQWPQGALLAVLAPYWLIVEWGQRNRGSGHIVAAGCTMLAFTYISARSGDEADSNRRALVWIGSICLIPSVIICCALDYLSAARPIEPYSIAVTVSLGLAIVLRGRNAMYNASAIAWVLLLVAISSNRDSVGQYLWLGLGAIGLAGWGILERRAERINLGVAGFALTVLAFYFSTVMDKIGRSASLIGLGVLFLAGGYGLERVRRRLIAQTNEGA